MATTIEHWVGGKRVADPAGRRAPVFNPATGRQQAEVALASAAEVDEAVQVAGAAFADWSQSSLSRRAKILFAFRELVNGNLDELAELITDSWRNKAPARVLKTYADQLPGGADG